MYPEETWDWYRPVVRFNVVKRDSDIGPIHCIYIISKRTTLDNGVIKHNPIYIDTTDNLKDCIDNHPLLQCFNDLGWSHIHYLRGLSPEDEQCIKKDIIEIFSPPCNS